VASRSDRPAHLGGPATRALAVVLLIVFAVEAATGSAGDETALLRFGALPDDGRLRHEYWRLITYSFLHLTSIHLLLNLGLLWWVGSIVERRIGSLLMCAAYFLAVIISGVSIVVAHLNAPRPGSSMGASGGVFGLLACALILLRRRDAAHFTASTRVQQWLWIVVLAGLAASLLPGVSLAGHVGGLIGGTIAGVALPVRQPSRT
jgi:rhomboid protease GluP